MLDENIFIEGSLRATTLAGLSDDDLAAYRAPYPTRESRRRLLAWPRAMPLEGESADVVARIAAYDAWLASSADIPKLLLAFDTSPTLMVGPELVAWCAANIANLTVTPCGPAGHLAPEDQPEAIAAALVAWLDRLGLRSADGAGLAAAALAAR